MKMLRRLSVQLAVALLAVSVSIEGEPNQTNFVFFLVDDLGWPDIGAFGSKFHETPNIDALAASGMKFNYGYAACPVCSPTRASIMTGRHPVRVNITDWLPGKNGARVWNARFLHVDDGAHLELGEVTIAEALKGHGYQTFFAGKWHLGGEGHLPTDQGFDINIGGHHRGSPPGGYYAPWTNPYLKSKKKDEYLTERLTEESIAFLNSRKKEQPFLLYLSYYNVHTPIQPYKKRVEHYKTKAEELYKGKDAPAPRNERFSGTSRMRQDNAAYASMVAAVDDSVGAILKSLEDLRLAENTVVIFFSDNGGLCTLRSAGPTSNLPLRAGKGWLYEGGVREPMIIRAPGVTRPGSVTDEPAVSMDFFPTMLELAGLPSMPDRHVDGKSLVPVLKGDSIPQRDLYWHYPHYHGSNWRPGASIRSGDWKLIEFYESDEVELFNLKGDLGEHKDLSKTNPEKTQELRAKLRTWQKSMNATMPQPNPKYDPNATAPPKGWGRRKPRADLTKKPAELKLKGAKTRASSHETGNYAENAFDGNMRTRWAANGGTVPQWWMLELPKENDAKELTIHWQNNTWFKYVVEVSLDGKAWRKSGEEQSEEKSRVNKHDLEGSFRFLRINVSALGAGWVSVREIVLK